MPSTEEEPTPLMNSSTRVQERRSDKWFIVYVIFFFCGTVTLLPWNFFITAVDFFKFKFRNVTLPPENSTSHVPQTRLQLMYENYLVVFASVSNSLFMFVNVLLAKRCSRNSRFLMGNVLLVISFTTILTFAKLNTNSYQFAFFCISILMAVLANAGSAFTQGSVVGLAGIFPERYTKAVMEGQALGGIVAATANILSLYLASDPISSGLFYFSIALLFILVSVVAFMILPRFSYSRQFMLPSYGANPDFLEHSCNSSDEPLIRRPSTEEVQVARPPRLRDVLWKVKVPALDLFFIFFVTLAIFPAVLARVQPMTVVPGDPWTNTYFTPVMCFLVFNTCDYIGRFLIGFSGVIGRRFLWLHNLLVILRAVFFPLILMCNVQPRHQTLLPVVLNHDFWPGLLTGLLGISNGYLATSSVILTVTRVRPNSMELAGNVAMMFVVFGITCGGMLSLALVVLV